MKKKLLSSEGIINGNISSKEKPWLEQELAECKFKDVRLGKRFRALVEKLWKGVGESIPLACQDWANTKAAYRFLSNGRVNEKEILRGHFQSTRDRFAETKGHVLILHDTTEFSYKRVNPRLIGSIRSINPLAIS